MSNEQTNHDVVNQQMKEIKAEIHMIFEKHIEAFKDVFGRVYYEDLQKRIDNVFISRMKQNTKFSNLSDKEIEDIVHCMAAAYSEGLSPLSNELWLEITMEAEKRKIEVRYDSSSIKKILAGDTTIW